MRGEKHREIVETLRKDIADGRYGLPGRPFPSERALARRFGVSRATAGMALRELRGKGLVAQEMGRGTFLTRKARSLAGSIGLLLPDLNCGEIFPPISRELSRLAQKEGYTLIFGDASADDPADRARLARDLARKFVETPVSGVIYKPIESLSDMERVNREIVATFDKAKVPVVLLDWDIAVSPDRSRYDVVGINNFEAGRRLADYLLRTGAKRVRFVTWRNCANSVRNRVSGVRSILPDGAKAELALDVTSPAAVRRAFSGRRAPDAVICGNDTNAARLLASLRAAGKRVPEDVQVVGFDDVQHAALVEPALTTVHQPCEDIARQAFRFLLDRMEDSSLTPRECLLEAPLVVRRSTKPLKTAGSRVPRDRTNEDKPRE